MKRFCTAVLVAVSVAGFTSVFACGGMTQIDPPSLMVHDEAIDTAVPSVIEDLQKIVVLC